MAVTVELAACQAYITPDTYASEAHFEALLDRMGARLDAARTRRGGDYAYPCLAVFPETIGAFLPLVDRLHLVGNAKTTDEALGRVARSSLLNIASAMMRGKTVHPTGAFLLSVAPEVRRMYRRAFSRFARRYSVWTVAGSAFLPRNAYGDLADPFLAAGGRIYDNRFDGHSHILERMDTGARVLAEARRGDISPDAEDVVLETVEV